MKYKIGFGLWLQKIQMAPPPLALAPAFIFAAVLEVEPIAFNEAEIAELLVALSLAIISFGYWLALRGGATAKAPLYYFLLVIFISALSMTEWLLSDESQKANIEHRLKNGYEKFAKRYERVEYPFGIAKVLEEYNQLRPNNTVILRRIATNYEKMGQPEQVKKYLKLAVIEGLRRYDEDPLNIATNVSLAKTYRQAKDKVNTRLYAYQAYLLAKKMVKQNPNDAYWAYWMGKSSEQVNKHRTAFYYYHRAYKIKPKKSQYRRAYYKKKRVMEQYYGS